MTTYGQLELNDPPDNIQNIWKYIDLHRFIYLLTEQRLFFTRLDKFVDPYEGIPTKVLRRNNKYSNVPLNENQFSQAIPKDERRRLINEKKLHDYLKPQDIEKSQQRQFVSCWLADDRESMAMWSIYSNNDSVALKVNFKDFENSITNSFNSFIEKNSNRLSIIGDVVKYLKLNPFDRGLPKQNMKFSALKKDESFSYEKEYRFLIYTKEMERKEPFYAVPIDLDSLNLTVVTHPNMEDWKHKNIKNLIEISKTNISLEKSAIILRKGGS